MKTLDRPTPTKTSPQPGDTVSKATNGQKSSRNGSLTEALESKLAQSGNFIRVRFSRRPRMKCWRMSECRPLIPAANLVSTGRIRFSQARLRFGTMAAIGTGGEERSRRCAMEDAHRRRAGYPRWTFARRSGVSAVSSKGNGRRSMDAARSAGIGRR